MLLNASRVGAYAVEARDGAIGSIRDLLVDEAGWAVRWLVIDTGTWLPGRQVLFPPSHVGLERAETGTFTLEASREEVRASPPLDADQPVSRRYEERLTMHYGWPAYWLGLPYAPAEPSPGEPPPVVEDLSDPEPPGDPRLRSTRDTVGCHIHARDGSIGHIDDFLVDTDAWVVRYLVVDTRNWWPGKLVLVPPAALTGIDWSDRAAEVNLTRDQIRNGPEYDPGATLDREWERRYLGYHGYPIYW